MADNSEVRGGIWQKFELIQVFIRGGGGGGRLLVSCVPMREQKNDEKGYFFRAGQCAAVSSFREGKILFLKEKCMFLQILQKVVEARE